MLQQPAEYSTEDIAELRQRLDACEAELTAITAALAWHGLGVDQVDIADDGALLYRWTWNNRQSLETWRDPGKALAAALAYVLGDA